MSSSFKSFSFSLLLFAAGPKVGARWFLSIWYERKKNCGANCVQKHGVWVGGVKGAIKLVAQKDHTHSFR